jgi:hypothetical protein
MLTARPTLSVKNCVLAGGLLIAAFLPYIAGAALGEVEPSVQDDAAALRGSVKVTEHANYRLHEIQLPSGSLLREFVGSDGKVFAVAWNGPTVPNLRQAFGRYFDTFVTAPRVRRAGHTQLQIQRSDLVVQASGHMRAFSGRAFLPQSLPSGVAVGDLR